MLRGVRVIGVRRIRDEEKNEKALTEGRSSHAITPRRYAIVSRYAVVHERVRESYTLSGQREQAL